MKPDSKRHYLGDGAYVELDGLGGVRIFAHDGETDTDEVYLEPDMMESLERWWAARKAEVTHG